MPTPRKGYFTADGSKVPSVTTILSRWKESGGLMQWAFQQGQAGKSHLYEEAEKAADIGTCAHAMVEMHIKGRPAEDIATYAEMTMRDPGMLDKARSAFAAYEAWASNFGFRVLEQEMQLVSEKYRYGGTPDAVGVIGNQVVLIDFKTSNKIYGDYLLQLAAYGQLWNENRPGQSIMGGYHLCRFSKENSDFSHNFYPSLDVELEQFLLLRRAYELDQVIKKRAA
jgi:hypothetical protein